MIPRVLPWSIMISIIYIYTVYILMYQYHDLCRSSWGEGHAMALSPAMIDHLGRSLQPKQLSGRSIVLQSRHLYVYKCVYYIYTKEYTSTYSYMHVYQNYIIHAQSLHIISNVVWELIHGCLLYDSWILQVDDMFKHRIPSWLNPSQPHLHWTKCVRPASELAPHRILWVWHAQIIQGLQSTTSHSCSRFIHIWHFKKTRLP